MQTTIRDTKDNLHPSTVQTIPATSLHFYPRKGNCTAHALERCWQNPLEWYVYIDKIQKGVRKPSRAKTNT